MESSRLQHQLCAHHPVCHH
uniref:Uncharacterized protein n=1 Tax=Anguilla anguilla TaxID=7936 RepID=A0A0E9VD08_ANGAN